MSTSSLGGGGRCNRDQCKSIEIKGGSTSGMLEEKLTWMASIVPETFDNLAEVS